jgi:hypothetical protein
MLDPERNEAPAPEPTVPGKPTEPAKPTVPGKPTEPAKPTVPGEPPEPARADWPAVAYWAAPPPQPPLSPAPPAAPTWTKAYELPSARSVVSAGFQLVLASSAAVRRTSIYIGLLTLGAIGPVVILLLIGIGRLMSDPTTADTILSDPSLLFFEQPEIAQPLTLIYVLVVAGFLLLAAIGVDAQAIAIAMLAGVAAERPLRLAEAITRARQTFWRLIGAGFIVGLVSGIVSLVVSWPFLRPGDTNTGVSFIGSMIGILVVSPWAFAATSIVLGDVGVVESLRRSVKLFRARMRIALVVVLFTLVTAAIQTFALGAGLDVAIRVGELFQFGLDQGPVSLIVPGILVLAFVVAFGSLTFTIAAIVAAPQVAAFLGLTFHSGGLDRARAREGFSPGLFHWVSAPMAVAMVLIVIAAAAGLPLITNFQPRAPSPMLQVLRPASAASGSFLLPFGESGSVEDPPGDTGGAASPALDILVADLAYVPEVPGWLLNGLLSCSSPGVSCSNAGSEARVFQEDGALIFVQRMAAAPAIEATGWQDWAVLLRLYESEVSATSRPYAGASHVVATRLDGGTFAITMYTYGTRFRMNPVKTSARSVWIDRDLMTIIPLSELPGEPIAWGMQASGGTGAIIGSQRDALHGEAGRLLLTYDPPYLGFAEGSDVP